MELTRREALASGAAMLACSRLQARAPHAPSLNALARRSGRRFGSAVGVEPARRRSRQLRQPCLRGDPRAGMRAAGARERAQMAVGRGPGPIASTFASSTRSPTTRPATASNCAATRSSGPRPNGIPKWLAEHAVQVRRRGRAPADRRTCAPSAAATATRIYSYDVVNEAVQPETGAIRDTNVTRALGGEAFLDLMFHTARAEAPHAQLVYNDYMSWERNSEDETHMRGVLKLLEGFRKRGTPVDALGVQSHIRLLKHASVAEIVRESEGPWRRFLDEVVGMGYQLLITEFDVNDHMAPTAIAPRDRMVADYAKAYLDLMLSYPQLGDVLCWGMIDRYCLARTASIRAPTRRSSAARLMMRNSGPSRCARRLHRRSHRHAARATRSHEPHAGRRCGCAAPHRLRRCLVPRSRLRSTISRCMHPIRPALGPSRSAKT